jgi:hypothetical protein
MGSQLYDARIGSTVPKLARSAPHAAQAGATAQSSRHWILPFATGAGRPGNQKKKATRNRGLRTIAWPGSSELTLRLRLRTYAAESIPGKRPVAPESDGTEPLFLFRTLSSSSLFPLVPETLRLHPSLAVTRVWPCSSCTVWVRS